MSPAAGLTLPSYAAVDREYDWDPARAARASSYEDAWGSGVAAPAAAVRSGNGESNVSDGEGGARPGCGEAPGSFPLLEVLGSHCVRVELPTAAAPPSPPSSSPVVDEPDGHEVSA